MDPGATPVRVWDLPTRVFHWVLALCVLGSIVSAKIGGNAMAWHFRSGYVVFTLLLFRIVWGLIGGHWSRFVSFSYAPATALRYLRGQGRPNEHHDVGHSPLGAMLTGDKSLTVAAPASLDNLRSRTIAAVLCAACAGAVTWLVSLGAQARRSPHRHA